MGINTVPDSEYDEDDLPFLPLHWGLVNKENYGRGRVELFAGDFAALSNVCETSAKLVAFAANVKIFVDPSSMIDVDKFISGESGDVVAGKGEGITAFLPEVFKTLDALHVREEKLGRKIGKAFLMNSAVTRDAERVTAQEIRLQALELDATLGGVYTALGNQIQRPIAIRLLRHLKKDLGKLNLTVMTGLQSLTRLVEIENWKALLADIAGVSAMPPQAFEWVKLEKLIQVLGAGYSLDVEKIIRTEKEHEQYVAQLQAQAQAQAGTN